MYSSERTTPWVSWILDDAGELAESEKHRPTPHAIERTHHASPRTLVFDPTPFICRVFCWLTFVLWDLANGSETKRYGRGRDSNDFTANKKMMIGPMSCVRRQIPTETSSRPGPAVAPLVPVARGVQFLANSLLSLPQMFTVSWIR